MMRLHRLSRRPGSPNWDASQSGPFLHRLDPPADVGDRLLHSLGRDEAHEDDMPPRSTGPVSSAVSPRYCWGFGIARKNETRLPVSRQLAALNVRMPFSTDGFLIRLRPG